MAGNLSPRQAAKTRKTQKTNDRTEAKDILNHEEHEGTPSSTKAFLATDFTDKYG